MTIRAEQYNSSNPLESKDETKSLLPRTTFEATRTSSTDSSSSHQTSELYGYSLMAMSSLFFSGMSFSVHLATSEYKFPVFSAFFVRAIIQSVLASIYIATHLNVSRMVASFTPRQWKLLVFRGFIGSFGMVFLFASLKLLPVGEAVTIFFFSPIITLLISGAVLGEPITKIDAAAAITSFLGIAIVARPGVETVLVTPIDRLIGSLCALLAAFFAASAYVTVRHLGTGVHFMNSVLSLGLSSLLISIILGGAMSPPEMIQMKKGTFSALASALFAFIGQCFLNLGLQHCPAGPGAIVRNLDVPIAYVLGLLFLGEKASWLSLFGSALVLAGTILIGLRKMF